MTNNTHTLTHEDLEKFIVFLNSDKLPKELLPYGAAAALCLGTGCKISEILKLQKCDVFSADGDPLQRISFSKAVKRNGKIKEYKKVTIIFPWVKLGKPVRRWYNSRKRSSKQALFSSRAQSPCSKYSAYLREIASLAEIEPGKIKFSTLRTNAQTLRFVEAAALLEIKDLLPRLRKFAAFLNK